MSGMESIDNFIDICDQLQSCSSIEEVRNLGDKQREVIGSSEEGGGEDFQISGKNPKLGKSRIPSVNELIKQVDGLIAEVNELADPARPLPIGSMNNENEIDFESRRSIFNEIVEAIKDDGVGMIGIWGMPGIGKTTLVKEVAKHARDKRLFQEVAMAVVSQNPSFKSIQGQIADMIGLKFTSESEAGRANQLHQTLRARKKPILIILDDIWKTIELNDIGIPSESQYKGCKIILTSRNRGVCEEMGTEKNFKIDLLSAKEALSLFLHMSGIDNEYSEKGGLAEKLSEECGRLPISIVIVARGLRNKEQNYWTDMLNRLRNSDPDERVQATIRLSYDNLNRKEEEIYFLLCALFPEDYKIPVQVLFEYGLGLGFFVRVKNVDEALVRAQNLASRLKSQCLLLDEGDENFVKMHDVIRDVALAIASEGKHAFLVPGKTATYLRFDDDVKKLLDVSECPQLQILILNTWYRDFQPHNNFFARMKNLIVLHISYMSSVQLPQFFAALENLRTLRFSYCNFRDISIIGQLQNLDCLSFYASLIQVFPKEVGELSNLKLLDLSYCNCSNEITPNEFQNLSKLEALRLGPDIQWSSAWPHSNSIHLSSGLTNLEISIPNTSMLPDDVLLGNLSKFNISIGKGGPNLWHIFFSNSQILRLTSLSANELLKAGIKMLMKKAQRLVLEDISGIFVPLPSHLWQFDAKSTDLANPSVESCDKLEFVFKHSSTKSVKKLKELEVRNCRNLKAICPSEEQEDPNVFPQLSHLKLWELENLTSFGSKFTSESTLFSKQVVFLTLETLDIYELEKLEKIWHIHTPVESFFKLKVLKLTGCLKLLVVFPPQATLGLRNLEEIYIENCPKLETLFQLDNVSSIFGDEMVLFPQLLTLKLVNLPKLTAILTSHSISNAMVIFSTMEIMTHNLETIMDQQLLTFFPKLKKLELTGMGRLSIGGLSTLDSRHGIKGLEAFEELMIEANNGNTLAQGLLSKIRILELGFIREPIESCERLDRGFQKLTSLKFFSCNGVKSLLTPSALSCLVQLQELFVSNCEIVESIVGEMSGEQNFDEAIEFSKLRYLKLDNLPCLTSFYNGECALKFPCLGDFSIIDCPKLKTFASMSRETPEPSCQSLVSEEALFCKQVSFGRLSHLVLERLESMEEIWHRGYPAATVGELIDLSVEGCDRLLKVFPSNLLAGLQNLTEVQVRSCRSLEHVFEVEDHPPLLSNLKNLELYDLPELKQLWWNKITCESFGLPSLYYLAIKSCPTLPFIFDPSVANRLENLKTLVVENCSSMVEIVAEKPGKNIEFPLLDTLHLVNLPCFKVNQSLEFPQAESVLMYNCFNMKKRRYVSVRRDLAGPVRFFESFVK